MNLYLIRHGRTDTVQNDNIIQSNDTPLGEYGIKQAQKLAKKLKPLQIDHIYSSDYQRAIDTATRISELTAISFVVNSDVREKQKDPSLCGARIDSEINLRFIQETDANIGNYDWRFNDLGESQRDLYHRAQKVCDFLVSQHAHDSIAIVSHAYFIEAFLSYVLLGDQADENTRIHFARSLRINNASITTLQYNPDKKTWKLLTLNDYSHLKKDWLDSLKK